MMNEAQGEAPMPIENTMITASKATRTVIPRSDFFEFEFKWYC